MMTVMMMMAAMMMVMMMVMVMMMMMMCYQRRPQQAIPCRFSRRTNSDKGETRLEVSRPRPTQDDNW